MVNIYEEYIWAEKYRPKTADDFIGNTHITGEIKKWLDDKEIPHLLFYGKPGTGKTTLAQILVNSIECDYIYVNASDKSGVDFIRNEVIPFANGVGFFSKKIVILDESDFLSPTSLATLRNVMESTSKNTRFILTCNYVDKIIPAVRSRVQEFNVVPPTKKSLALRLDHILKNEGITYEISDIAKIINKTYPDLRKSINMIQQNTSDNKLVLQDNTVVGMDYMKEIIQVLKSDKDLSIDELVKNIRTIINDNGISTFTDLYTYLYDNVHNIVDESNMYKLILVIADYQYKDSFVLDKEINVMAMFIKLIENIKNKKE